MCKMTLRLKGLKYFNAFLGLFFWPLGPTGLVTSNTRRIRSTDSKLMFIAWKKIQTETNLCRFTASNHSYSSVVLNFTALLDEVQCGVCFWKALFFVLTTLWELLMPDISHDVAVIVFNFKSKTYSVGVCFAGFTRQGRTKSLFSGIPLTIEIISLCINDQVKRGSDWLQEEITNLCCILPSPRFSEHKTLKNPGWEINKVKGCWQSKQKTEC